MQKERVQLNEPPNGKDFHILIVHARWNQGIVDELVKGAVDSLGKCGAKFTVQSVPGCFELPFATKSLLLAANGKYHAAISIGVLIKGETMHFEYISSATTDALMRVGLDLCVPVIFGVLTCLDADQANERCGLGSSEKKHNHGIDWGFAAVEMARLSSSSG